jgi:hypothetical protein
MNNFHLLQNGCTVVGDEDMPLAVLDHFVHSSWAQACSDDIGNSLLLEDNVGLPLAA